MKRDRIDHIHLLKIISFGLLILIVIMILRNLPRGADDINMLMVFNLDEGIAVERMMTNLENADLNPRGFYDYGYFYPSVVFGLGRVSTLLGADVTVKIVTVIARLTSALAFILLLFFVFQIQKSLCLPQSPIPFMTILFMASTEDMYTFAQLIHPDMLQTLLIVLAASIAFSNHTFQLAVWGALCAGLAFGTKYGGAFILPFLFLPALIVHIGHIDPIKLRFRDWARPALAFVLMIILFLVGWVATNPTAPRHLDKIFSRWQFEKNHIASGHGLEEPANPFLWFEILGEQMTPFGSILVLIGFFFCLAYVIGRFVRSRTSRAGLIRNPDLNCIAMIAYVVAFMIFLMIVVRLRSLKYMFPIFPFLVILGFYGWDRLTKVHVRKHRWILAVLLFLCILPMTYKTLKSNVFFLSKDSHPYLRAGQYLSTHFPLETKILADYYTYVSPQYRRCQFVWGMNPSEIESYDPGLIIINDQMSGRWSWKAPGTVFSEMKYVLGTKDNAALFAAFHRDLFSSESEWGIVYEDTGIVFLTKKNGPFSHLIQPRGIKVPHGGQYEVLH